MESNISITNASNVSVILITGNNIISIFCYQNVGFVFEGIKRLIIKGLTLIGCGNNKVKLVENFC